MLTSRPIGILPVWLVAAILVGFCVTPAKAQATRQEQQPTALGQRYEKWLDEDVRWIITPAEWIAFRRLRTNEERDRFIEQFWVRRNPNPESAKNEYKKEHYRRLAYANMSFGSSILGSKTDRGRVYILYGPPDVIKSSTIRSSGYPRVVLWLYKVVPGIGTNVEFKFMDVCDCGDYQLKPSPNFKLQPPLPSAPPTVPLLQPAGSGWATPGLSALCSRAKLL